jgi:hypothetical protein
MDAYSNYELSVLAMRQQGMSEEKARQIAEQDFWREVGYSGMLGWLSASGSALVSQGMAHVTGQGTAPEAQQPVQQETLPVQPAEAEPGSMLPQEAWPALPDDAAAADGQTVQEAMPLGDMPVQEADAVRQTVSEAAADFATEAAVDQAAVDQSIAGTNMQMVSIGKLHLTVKVNQLSAGHSSLDGGTGADIHEHRGLNIPMNRMKDAATRTAIRGKNFKHKIPSLILM